MLGYHKMSGVPDPRNPLPLNKLARLRYSVRRAGVQILHRACLAFPADWMTAEGSNFGNAKTLAYLLRDIGLPAALVIFLLLVVTGIIPTPLMKSLHTIDDVRADPNKQHAGLRCRSAPSTRSCPIRIILTLEIPKDVADDAGRGGGGEHAHRNESDLLKHLGVAAIGGARHALCGIGQVEWTWCRHGFQQ